MRPPSLVTRNTSTPDLKESDDPNSTSGLTAWFNRQHEEVEVPTGDERIDVDLDAGMEEDAMRFFELPVESTGGRRRRLLAQFCDNTNKLDAWLRRLDQQTPVLPGEPSDLSEPRSSGRRPPERKWPRQMLIRGSIRNGYGIRKPPSNAGLSEEFHLSREEHEMMLHWESQWQAQELEHQREAAGAWCRTPSFGAEASPSSQQEDEFAAEVRAICGDPSLEFAAPPPQAKHRVTLPNCQFVPPEEEEASLHAMSREERLMRFCPEVVNPAFSEELKEVLQKSLVRGASKVLAEHRGHRMNRERFHRKANDEESVDTQKGLRLAMHLHARSQQKYRRGCPATPPLQGVPLRPGSVARQSPDFVAMRQALPPKSTIISVNRKRKKPQVDRPVGRAHRYTLVSGALGGPKAMKEKNTVSRSNSPHLFEPVLCSPECRNWRSPSPLQVRLEQEEGLVVGSQWRDFLEDLRQERSRGSRKKASKSVQLVQSSQDSGVKEEEQLKTKDSLENGKVEDCPDAHAYYLVRQGKLEALERWNGLQFVRPSMLRHLLFYVARQGTAPMLQWLLARLASTKHPDALHWREQDSGATLLHAAAQADMLAICALLEELGADLQALDQNGKHVLQVAGPFCKEVFNTYSSFRFEDKSQQGSTLRTTSQALSEHRSTSRSATRRL